MSFFKRIIINHCLSLLLVRQVVTLWALVLVRAMVVLSFSSQAARDIMEKSRTAEIQQQLIAQGCTLDME
jgi:hypothetical protein